MEIGTLSSDASEARFAAYVDGLAEVLGHGDRVEPFNLKTAVGVESGIWAPPFSI
jgi:SRSO17 transposase